MSNQPMNRPPWINLFGLEWEYSSHAPRFHRFGVSDGCRGVGSYANPLTAYLALRRWRKEPAMPEPHPDADRPDRNEEQPDGR